MTSPKIKVAVVGAGHAAQVAHIPSYKQNPNVELSAVVDEDPVKAKRIQKQFGFREWYEDFSAMLHRSDAEAVDICTPNYLHAPMAIAALRSGRHVLCEKPLARNATEAAKMVETAESNQRVLMAAMNNRFREDVRVLRTFVDNRELGDIHFAKVGWLRQARQWRERSWVTEKTKAGGGALLDLGLPLMDLAMWIAGLKKATAASCLVFDKTGQRGVENSAAALVRFAGGASLMLEVNWNLRAPRDQTYLHVYGTKGAATLNPLQVHKAIHGVLVNVTPALKPARNYYKESYRLEIDHFIECVRENKTPLATGSEAVSVLGILDAMYESAASGREVELPR